MMVRASILVAALALLAVDARGQNGRLQTGIRIDAYHSIQWSGNRLFLEDEAQRTLFDIAGDEVFEVWDGPGVGFFSIWTRKGLGFLWGSRAVVAPNPFGSVATLRSSRSDSIVGLRNSASGVEFVELRADVKTRVLVRVEKTPVVDFDVDRAGRIVYLTSDNDLFRVTDANVTRRVSRLDYKQARFRRIFVDGAGTELVAYAPGVVALGTGDGWRYQPFDESRYALVRNVLSRGVRAEPKFP